MTKADSKKLEEIKDSLATNCYSYQEMSWLFSFVKEQDREIERLRAEITVRPQWAKLAIEMLQELRQDYPPGYLDEADGLSAVMKLREQRDYQHRHRKWALEQCREWQRFFCFYKDDAVRFHSDRADKAEAEVDRLKAEKK